MSGCVQTNAGCARRLGRSRGGHGEGFAFCPLYLSRIGRLTNRTFERHQLSICPVVVQQITLYLSSCAQQCEVSLQGQRCCTSIYTS